MLLRNNTTPITFGSGKQHAVLDTFFGYSGKKQILLESGAHVVYAAILNDADVDFDIRLCGSDAHVEFFGIFVGDVKSQAVTQLMVNTTFARVHLYCVVKGEATMQVDGNIVIAKDVEDVEGHLVEEQFLLGTPRHLLVRPLLDVHSHRVKASHAAKIHTLDQQKLFYMMAKGLSLHQAQKIVVEASLQSVFDRISDVDDLEKQQIFTDILHTIFTSSEHIG